MYERMTVPAVAKQRKGIRIFHFRPMLLILLILDRLINLASLCSNMGIREYWSTPSEALRED
jgi:hypothetical protein